jgi:hypothetical protein
MDFIKFPAAAWFCVLGVVAFQTEATPGLQGLETREQPPQLQPGPNTRPANVEQAVRSTMSEQYGAFDSELGCWRYAREANGERYEYCMMPRGRELVETSQGWMLYFFASNRSDIRGNPKYTYSLPDSGVMGAFALKMDSSSAWKLMAATRHLDFGSIGNFGCESAKFVKLGREYYGWMFVSGGVWQGIASLSHSLVAPHDQEFADLSEVPMQTESDQSSEYGIEIDESSADEDHYPLIVTKFGADSDSERTRIIFDGTRWRYSLPKKNADGRR